MNINNNKKRTTSARQLNILRDIFKELGEQNVPYVMIHGRDIFDGNTTISDVDIVFDKPPKKILSAILHKMQNEGVFKIVQCLHYDVIACFYYILSINDANGISYLHLDCMHDPVGINSYFFPAAELLHNRRVVNGINAPSVAAEFLYLVVKKSRKGKLDHSTKSDIEILFSEDRTECLSILHKYIKDTASVSKIIHYIDDGVLDKQEVLAEVHQIWKQEGPGRRFRIKAERLIKDIFRKIRRLLRPSGFFVVFMGPDGSGKSTIAEGVLDACHDGYRKTVHFHWRPELLPRPGGKRPSIDDNGGVPIPALKSKYGFFMSLLRFSYYYMDFILGYWVKLYPNKAATSLIVGERYYYDILVHPERYGFDLPKWLYRVLIHFIPRPDMIILLSNEPEVIAARKDELPVEEIRRQLHEYRSVIKVTGHSYEISTEGTIDEVVQRVSMTIIDQTSEKNRCCDL